MSNELFSLRFHIETPLISVNDAYMDCPKKTKTGRWTAYRTAAPALREYQDRLSTLITDAINPLDLTFLQGLCRNKDHGLVINISVGLPVDLFKRSDASNFIKPYEDVLSSVLHIDDKYNFHVGIDKYISESWKIDTDISIISLERWNNLFYEKAPTSEVSENISD